MKKKKLTQLIAYLWTYIHSLKWILKKYSIFDQVAMIKSGGKRFFYDFLCVRNNYERVTKYLKKVKGERKIRVCFLVSETAKWNMQSLYDELLKSNCYYPFIVVTNLKNLENRPSYQHVLEFYRCMADNVEIGWDEQSKESIDLKIFSPDIVFYQQPWQIYANQSVAYASRFALTYYISYSIENVFEAARPHLCDFYSLLNRYLVFSETYKFYYLSSCPFKLTNLVSIDGHPKLDIYADYRPSDYDHKYIIYAPHHSFAENSLKYGTFPWSGKFILKWAKTHQEINWVFKPHPKLKQSLVLDGIMSQSEVEEYYNEWAKIGLDYEDGNYFGLFKESRCLITDCGSFLTEYLPTQMPVIHLRNKDSKEFSPTTTQIIDSYYKAYDLEELNKYFNEIILDRKDPLLEERKQIMKIIGLSKFDTKSSVIKIINRQLS